MQLTVDDVQLHSLIWRYRLRSVLFVFGIDFGFSLFSFATAQNSVSSVHALKWATAKRYDSELLS